MERQLEHHDRVRVNQVIASASINTRRETSSLLFSHPPSQQAKTEPCSELELIAIRACAATLCCGIITDEWFHKTAVPWLDQFMAAHEVGVDSGIATDRCAPSAYFSSLSLWFKIHPALVVSFDGFSLVGEHRE